MGRDCTFRATESNETLAEMEEIGHSLMLKA
jgi:hypothetical protein